MLKKVLTVLLAALMVVACVPALFACQSGGSDGSYDDEGNYKPGDDGTVTVSFWGYGDSVEVDVFGSIVKEFNATVGAQNNIEVDYRVIPSTSYSSTASMALGGSNGPDVLYVEDKYAKSWADAGYLEQIDRKNAEGSYIYPGLENFLDGSIWDSGISRYRYDVETATSTDTAALWALPKDIGPTVIYYNVNYFEQLDIEIISIPADELNGQYPEKGYFQQDGTWYFNNRVPMSWEETVALAQRLQTEIGKCDYGFFTEWWFFYGWSVGGDCVEYIQDGDGGYYKFTLNDDTYNYIVKDDSDPITVNGNTYKAGEIISYTDKDDLTSTQKESCNQLPSMKDAFLEFCSLTTDTTTEVGTKTDGSTKYGAGKVSMGASSLGTQQAEDLFAAGTIGMFVDGRWEVPFLRSTTQLAEGSWDVAPLPVYKEYDEDGNITVHGVQAGHSGSVGLSISAKSDHKNAAWLFLRYVAGEEGQTMQSEAGFCIPNQIGLANSETFLQSDQDPKNSIVFVEAASYETPGDWWYLKDSLWIDEWANYLNYTVREGKDSVDNLFLKYSESTQEALYKYTGYTPSNTIS